jgi:flagellar biosynthesis/type III secretory pathway protein FliH
MVLDQFMRTLISAAALGSAFLFSTLAAIPTSHAAPSIIPADFAVNYDEGYQFGYTTGYDSGFVTGKEQGQAEGTQQGRDAGFQVGWKETYAPAFDRAYAHEYPLGLEQGFDEGVVAGFYDGVDWAKAVVESWGSASFKNNWCCGGGSSGSIFVSINNWSGSDFLIVNSNFDEERHYYDLGFSDGQTTGLSAGSTDGYNLTYPDAYEAAYPIGFADGTASGTTNGALDGAVAGFNDGWDLGFDEGYDPGFDAGVEYVMTGRITLSTAAASEAAVPEPSTALLATLAAAFAARRRSRAKTSTMC